MSYPVIKRLMTLEEAMHLADLRDDPRERFERPGIRTWQTIARAMAQTASHAPIETLARKPLRHTKAGRRQAG